MGCAAGLRAEVEGAAEEAWCPDVGGSCEGRVKVVGGWGLDRAAHGTLLLMY